MQQIKRALAASALVAAASVFASPSWGAVAVQLEFSEVALPNGYPLAGTEDFAPHGLHFAGSATYYHDTRFIGAGTDDRGIGTGAGTPTVGVLFDTPAASVSFDGISINTVFNAIAYDSGGGILDTYVGLPTVPGTNYFSHTFSGVGAIARIDFHDNNQFVGVGRLEFEPVPEPASLGVIGLGASALVMRRRRRV